MGPPNISPKVPTFSTSATNTPSATPDPNAATPYLVNFSFLLKVVAIFLVSLSSAGLNPFKSPFFRSPKYFFAFFPLIAAFAKLAPLVKAIPPGIPRLTNVSVIFPAVVASAASSKGLISSNHCSTFAALLVPAPRSMRLAPKDITPSGILIRPEAIPDKTDSKVPTLFSGSSKP